MHALLPRNMSVWPVDDPSMTLLAFVRLQRSGICAPLCASPCQYGLPCGLDVQLLFRWRLFSGGFPLIGACGERPRAAPGDRIRMRACANCEGCLIYVMRMWTGQE